MKKNIEISEVFTIDTDENRCALLFCLQLQHELNDANMLFITANNFQLVHNNLERVKPYLSYFNTLHHRTKYLFLKDSWISLNEQYGARAFSNELSSLVEKSPQTLFFLHRIDLFFDKVFSTELEDVLIAFIKDIRYHHKKVIFSYNSKTATGKAFEALFVDRRDISYHIEEDKSDIDGDCYTTIKTYNKFLKKPYAQIVLISDEKEMIDMHKKIFKEQKNIHFKQITVEEMLQNSALIDETTDLVVYHDSGKQLDSRMIEKIKKVAHFSKIFYLSKKKFLRKTDRRQAQESGIEYIAATNFDLEEYIESIERVIENDFYTKKLKQFYRIEKTKEVDIEELKRSIVLLKQNGILFSLLSVNSHDVDVKNIDKLIREHDYLYIDHKRNTVVFVLLNILPTSAHEILSSRLGIKKTLVRTYHDRDMD